MIAFLLAPVYLAINAYILLWIFRFIDACLSDTRAKSVKIICAILYIFLCLTPLFAFLLPASDLKKTVARTGNYWMGVFLYTVIIVAALDLIRVIVKRVPALKKCIPETKRFFVSVCCFACVAAAGISIYGIWNAKNIQVTEYTVDINKDISQSDSLKIVLAADLHMGYSIGYRHVERIVRQINAQNPDIVCFAGDIFDNHYDAIDEAEKIKEVLRTIKAPLGVYACYGNHDYEEEILAGFTFSSQEKVEIGEQMRELLEESGIRTLEDETILVDDRFYLTGRRDYSSGKSGITRKSPEQLLQDLDKTKPIIVMDHQPKQLAELAEAGADLDLCGHTHDGQLFPGNIVTALMWENSCGYLKKEDMHNIVTSGAGIFGPYMRVGTKSEIVVINVL